MSKFVKVEYGQNKKFSQKELKQLSINRLIDGERCPFCGSNSMDGEGVDVGLLEASQECYCSECDAAWKDWYKFDMLQVIQ